MAIIGTDSASLREPPSREPRHPPRQRRCAAASRTAPPSRPSRRSSRAGWTRRTSSAPRPGGRPSSWRSRRSTCRKGSEIIFPVVHLPGDADGGADPRLRAGVLRGRPEDLQRRPGARRAAHHGEDGRRAGDAPVRPAVPRSRRSRALCRDRGIQLMEDCAHACGVRVDGKQVGTFGDIGVFSFAQGKNMPCIGGGAIAVTDDAVAERARQDPGDGPDRRRAARWSSRASRSGSSGS